MPNADAQDAAVDLPEEATLPGAARLHRRLVAALEEADQTLTVRFENVQRIDTAGVVALVEVALRARQRDITLRLQDPPEQARAMIDLLGVTDLLGLGHEDADSGDA